MHYVPDLNDVLAYDAVNVLAKAVETAHSTNEAKIRAALAGIQNYPGVGGPITFQKNGDGGTAALLFRVENGKEQLLP
jgi:branched-chain amino acid transport system substrate-binding protein